MLDTRAIAGEAAQTGARLLTYIEGFGDCMVYAVAFERHPDGSFGCRPDDPATPRAVRTHWCWGDRNLPHGNAFRWAGIQSAAMEDDFTRPNLTLRACGVSPPTYPDGRTAMGRLAGPQPPLDAELWDACASKDVNGNMHPLFTPAARVTAGLEAPHDVTEGLFRAIAGVHEIEGDRLPDGTFVWCGIVGIHKDLSAPFWREYARASARFIAQSGLDGVWCDNWSPWDNFGYPPVFHAFGEWSLHRFREYIAGEAPEAAVHAAGLDATSDVRLALKDRARAYGVADPSNLREPAWSDARWKDDVAWRLYRSGRQIQARRDLKAFNTALHEGARDGGCRDFLVCCNDIPLYGLGWARDSWTDMVHTEVTAGWHMGTGSRGIMLPPEGKMAVVYRAGLAHQSSRLCAVWYYLQDKAAPYQNRPGLGRVLMAEAFANGAFLLCDPQQSKVAGTIESHAWWNAFLRKHEERFARRRPQADVGVVFSPDCQLWELAPGGFPDMDRQPHIFGHWGWGTALMDAHIPYMAMPDWRLEPAALRRLKALILPDVECMSDGAVKAIEAWVRSGGLLVTTGQCASRHGTERAFEPRPQDAASWLRLAASKASTPLGKGRVVRLASGLGMEYYLRSAERAKLLPHLTQVLRQAGFGIASGAPPTLELALWRPDDATALDLDLANTDIDLARDTVRPCGPVRITVQAPFSGRVTANTVSPEVIPPATVVRDGKTLTVTLPRVVHYASVRLSSG